MAELNPSKKYHYKVTIDEITRGSGEKQYKAYVKKCSGKWWERARKYQVVTSRIHIPGGLAEYSFQNRLIDADSLVWSCHSYETTWYTEELCWVAINEAIQRDKDEDLSNYNNSIISTRQIYP